MNHVPPVQEPDLRHARCKPRLLAQARPARRGCLASLRELGAETRPHVTASQPAAGRVASKCSTRRQPHVDGCFGSHTCGCSRSAPISITCSSLEPGTRWQQQEDIRFLLPILETGVTIATHFELWPVCSGLLHDLYLQVGPASQSCRGPFGGAERLSLGTTSPLLRAHRAQAQRSAARPRQGSVYEGSPKCSQPDLSRCTVLKNSPSFQTGQGGLATSALSSHRGTQRERNVLPSPPPGDTAGPAGKHSLPARDWERHYVTRRISSKSYFWRQQGEGQVQPPAERHSRFPRRARRSRGTAASKTCLASPGCPQAVLSHHVPRPQVALEGCSPGCPRESPQGQ